MSNDKLKGLEMCLSIFNTGSVFKTRHTENGAGMTGNTVVMQF